MLLWRYSSWIVITDMLSLYLHIPFCKQKCAYCSFYSESCDNKTEYIDALIRCVKYYGQKYGGKTGTVYVGGGTPSVIGGQDIARLFESVYRYFDVDENAEITVEANPESVDGNFLDALTDSGVNRLSLGVQSFNDKELCVIGRLHDSRRAKTAIELARNYGFENINCDLIFGLPGSTAQAFEDSLKTLVVYGIPHISCYNLQLEKGTPIYENRQELPDETEQEKMYFCACETLEKKGYAHYEISNFAKPGYESRHNSAYWNGSDYLGLGPSAHSKVGGERFWFAADTAAFIIRDEFEPDGREAITDARFEKLMLSLRTSNGIHVLDVPESAEYIKRLVFGGFADVRNDRIILTDKGFYLSNTIITDIARSEGL